MPATFYIASLPFQDTPPNGGSARAYQGVGGPLNSSVMAYQMIVRTVYLCIATFGANIRICRESRGAPRCSGARSRSTCLCTLPVEVRGCPSSLIAAGGLV